jgi:hypothetical protein
MLSPDGLESGDHAFRWLWRYRRPPQYEGEGDDFLSPCGRCSEEKGVRVVQVSVTNEKRNKKTWEFDKYVTRYT